MKRWTGTARAIPHGGFPIALTLPYTIFLLGCAFALLTPNAAWAQERIFRIEVHPIPTRALTTAQFLAGEQGQAITIAGELRLPAVSDEQRLPAVVLTHGGG